ncbi:DUF1748 domain-containing protein [Ascoidea rubescens DSM 1968]|uniref:DUF1748-domain-containing protein n=1 Tax=Ascoidea rubescens DSM 1968 TaxID=1344418 RepID=A0A1D2V9I8_9ASCO|nr:DUF1748-domain-containing protein [Ascoidea rubescens DSM 1968]ODV58320.1 DUF1748-domain-containing protein [Ascoidea rubescens DSM 1968]
MGFIHYTFDLLLLSILLAGVRRDTGLTLDPNDFHSLDIRRYLSKYLYIGEVAYDYLVSFLKSTGLLKIKTNNVDNFLSSVKRNVSDFNRDFNDISNSFKNK